MEKIWSKNKPNELDTKALAKVLYPKSVPKRRSKSTLPGQQPSVTPVRDSKKQELHDKKPEAANYCDNYLNMYVSQTNKRGPQKIMKQVTLS